MAKKRKKSGRSDGVTMTLTVPKKHAKAVRHYVQTRFTEAKPINRDKLTVNQKELGLAWDRLRDLQSYLKPLIKQYDRLEDASCKNLNDSDDKFVDRELTKLNKLFSAVESMV